MYNTDQFIYEKKLEIDPPLYEPNSLSSLAALLGIQMIFIYILFLQSC